MNNIKNLERLQRLHALIANENTGTPNELASLLGISERKVYQLLENLKDLKAEISYSRSRKTYYYCDDFKLIVKISVTVLNKNEVTEIYGGSYFFNEKSCLQGSCIEQVYFGINKAKICA